MKVLMIDDDIGLGETMKPVLQMYAIDLDVVHSPEEGLEHIKSQQYDLVLLDVMLPRINGLKVCQTIRNMSDPVCNIPVIMLSARTELVDRVVGLETGADDYVAKPSAKWRCLYLFFTKKDYDRRFGKGTVNRSVTFFVDAKTLKIAEKKADSRLSAGSDRTEQR